MTDTLRDVGERELIRRFISPLISTAFGNIVNDDCAVLALPTGRPLLVSTDRGPQRSFLELLGIGGAADLAYFHVVANVSDIAAMGGEPIGMLLALGLPPEERVEFFQDYMTGIAAAASAYDIGLFGGDTKQAAVRTTAITMLGLQLAEGHLTRRGTRIGDGVFIIGDPVGTCLAEYVAIARARNVGAVPLYRPVAQVAAGQALARSGCCTACMDMSDGILSAARQLSEMNRVCFVIDPALIPFAPPPDGHDVDRWRGLVARVGGEFGLMFTAANEHADMFAGLGAIYVGCVTSGDPGVRLAGREDQTVRQDAWEQFSTMGSLSDEIRRLAAS